MQVGRMPDGTSSSSSRERPFDIYGGAEDYPQSKLFFLVYRRSRLFFFKAIILIQNIALQHIYKEKGWKKKQNGFCLKQIGPGNQKLE